MTEDEWLVAAHPARMLEFASGAMTNRKRLLFGLACVRSAAELIDDPRSRAAVEMAERVVEGGVGEAEAEACWLAAHAAVIEATDKDAPRAALGVGITAWRVRDALGALSAPDGPFRAQGGVGSDDEPVDSVWAISYDAATAWCSHVSQRFRLHAGFLRCLVGNPFRRVSPDPAWLTSDVTAIAAGISQDRAFDRLPILADALQDAGCDNADLLLHCREEEPHVCGCWVVDLILDKS